MRPSIGYSHPTPEPPGPGQESVWEYPRPAVCEPTSKLLEVELAGEVIARTTRGYRVLETSHPPTYYFPREDVREDLLVRVPRRTICEWKGQATWYDVALGDVRIECGAWSYLDPTPRFFDLAGYVSFFARPMDACRVDGELVTPQEGEFYGGWITDDVVGPFKGGPGTQWW